MSTDSITPVTPITASSASSLVSAASALVAGERAVKGPITNGGNSKPRGNNRQPPQRTRYHGRNRRGLKTMANMVEALKGRKLTAREKGACAYLSMPLNRYEN